MTSAARTSSQPKECVEDNTTTEVGLTDLSECAFTMLGLAAACRDQAKRPGVSARSRRLLRMQATAARKAAKIAARSALATDPETAYALGVAGMAAVARFKELGAQVTANEVAEYQRERGVIM